MSARPGVHDLLVIGGGINGTGIARDAAGRGLSVLLCEQGDLASATSSASTKLIHGGLRYLENYEFRLVREALAERERLLAIAPHIVRPLRFVLPKDVGLRPAWMLRLGLFLYDHLSALRSLPGSQGLRLAGTELGAPLQERLSEGFAYSDCWVEDSRLVVLNALDARERGADIRTRTRLVAARREDGVWRATLADTRTGETQEARARIVVNAAGPWVSAVLSGALGLGSRAAVRLVKGSHIVTRRLYEGSHAYILQQPDKRIVFAIPYEGDFTLIGTTDVAHEGAPGPVAISEAETRYLVTCVNRAFRRRIGPQDVVWSYAGLRPLYDDAAADASAVTRDYVLDIDAPDGAAPALSVFGGKLTTYRRLAEHVLDKLKDRLPASGPAWTGSAPLPGGDMEGADFPAFLKTFAARFPFLPEATALRLARAYGTRAARVLGDAGSLSELGEDLGGGLSAAEVDYLAANEWARTAEDILWRRSKLGLHVPAGTEERVAAHLARGGAARVESAAAG